MRGFHAAHRGHIGRHELHQVERAVAVRRQHVGLLAERLVRTRSCRLLVRLERRRKLGRAGRVGQLLDRNALQHVARGQALLDDCDHLGVRAVEQHVVRPRLVVGHGRGQRRHRSRLVHEARARGVHQHLRRRGSTFHAGVAQLLEAGNTDEMYVDLLSDPQTSGGLLAAVPEEEKDSDFGRI